LIWHVICIIFPQIACLRLAPLEAKSLTDIEMMMKFASFLSVALLVCSASNAQPANPQGPVYRSDYSTLMALGRDLYSQLPPDAREMICSQPISLDPDLTPFIRLLYYPDQPKAIRGIWISAGLIDLVSRMAHAQAIDKVQKGYLAGYVDALAEERNQKPAVPLPNISNPAYWTHEVLNEQLSNFNSIIGALLGINLAHHYLGHYAKYRAQLREFTGEPFSINALLTPQEWDEACAAGIPNALRAGCMTEGVIPFYHALDRMKTRPKWAINFLPDFAPVSKLTKEMARLQKKFFASGKNS
jgi:hypothetical protein